LTTIDKAITALDTLVRCLVPPENRPTSREVPGRSFAEAPLTERQKQEIRGLIRVNHAGEVCAQALYQGQAMTAKLTHIRQQMTDAADEEIDHLAWCEIRLKELDASPSLLNPIWYVGSLIIGATAGLLGDKISLGFVAETEQQVSAHLQRHLARLPKDDEKTKAILEAMHADEQQHANTARNAGAIVLPTLIKKLMQAASKIMTKTSYYL
jgi:ubiquinone biosynthesis monooxygenase Coq7